MLQFWGREQRVALLGETTAGGLNSRGCAGCVVLSQDIETAGIATAGKIFHRTSVAIGQNWLWFAAVLFAAIPVSQFRARNTQEAWITQPISLSHQAQWHAVPLREGPCSNLKTGCVFCLLLILPVSLVVRSLLIVSITGLFPCVLAQALAPISEAVPLTAPHSRIFIDTILGSFFSELLRTGFSIFFPK